LRERKVEEGASALRFTSKSRNFMLAILFAVSIVATSALVVAMTWSDYENRLTTYLDFDGIPSVIQASDGAIWIFWTRKTENYDICYTVSSDEGLTWSPETQLTSNSSANTAVNAFRASDGTILLVWDSDRTGNYDIYYKTSSDLGSSWSNDTQLTNHAGRDLKPSVCQLSNGTIWVVWCSDRTGGYDIYLKTSSDDGVSWSDDFWVTNSPELDKCPSIAQMYDDTVWLVWASKEAGNYDLVYKIYDDSMWSSEEWLTDDPKVDSNPFVFQTLDGKIWIFWASREPAVSEPTTDDIYYKYSFDNGATWSAKTQFTNDPYDDAWPSAVQTSGTRVWIVWTSDRADQPDWGNWDIYYNKSLVGDVNEDGVVDIADLSLVGIGYGSFEGEPQYNPDVDINCDGIVDIVDISFVCINYGAT